MCGGRVPLLPLTAALSPKRVAWRTVREVPAHLRNTFLGRGSAEVGPSTEAGTVAGLSGLRVLFTLTANSAFRRVCWWDRANLGTSEAHDDHDRDSGSSKHRPLDGPLALDARRGRSVVRGRRDGFPADSRSLGRQILCSEYWPSLPMFGRGSSVRNLLLQSQPCGDENRILLRKT